jgi:hypothetical protein
MRKVLLAGVAALSVLSASAAHAATLPDTITGTWCFLESFDLSPGQAIFNTHTRTFEDCPHVDGRGTLDGIIINQGGIEAEDSSCTFEKIEQIRPNSFLIYHRCTPDENSDTPGGPETYEIIDGKLIITRLSEG